MMRHFFKKALFAGGLGGFMLASAGCYYGSYGYGSSYTSQVKTTADAETLEDFPITDFEADDGTFQYKSLAWGSSYEDLEELIGMSIGTTTAFNEGETMGDLNYSVKLLDYISVGMQPVYDADGGLTSLSIYFEQTYTSEELDDLYEKVIEAAEDAFGEADKKEEGEQTSSGVTYTTFAAYWYRETDKYGSNTMNSFQVGKIDTGNGTDAVVVGVNIYDPTLIEESSEEEGGEDETGSESIFADVKESSAKAEEGNKVESSEDETE